MQNFSIEEGNVVDFSAPLSPSSHEITKLLIRWANGDKNAIDRLIPLVYRQLHKLAKRYVAQQSDTNTLQTTALIHEAYIKLAAASVLLTAISMLASSLPARRAPNVDP